jgi:hypothetical protein
MHESDENAGETADKELITLYRRPLRLWYTAVAFIGKHGCIVPE